jgi:hypothetical protein
MKTRTALSLALSLAWIMMFPGDLSAAASSPARSVGTSAPVSTLTPARIKSMLDVTAREHLDRVARALRPSREHVATDKQQDGQFVAWYRVVDISSLRTELLDPKNTDGVYIGNVIYVVHEYSSTGPTGQEAARNEFRKVKSRRIREYAQFVDGAWRL